MTKFKDLPVEIQDRMLKEHTSIRYNLDVSISPVFQKKDKLLREFKEEWNKSMTVAYAGKSPLTEESRFIVQSYPELTGLNAIIKDIDATVLEVNIDNVATLCFDSSAYITDIKLSIGNGEFFTCSKFVEKVEDVVTRKTNN